MTDKQIIDGIDVTGCEYCSRYADTTIYHCDWIGECKEHPNCYYKQLKRAEQRIVEVDKTIKAKEQECEELKKIINEAKNSKLDLKSFLVGEAVQNEYEQQLDQLKATLAEIKELMKVEIECKTYEIENDCFNETRCKALKEHIDFTNEILKKISECEGTNDN